MTGNRYTRLFRFFLSVVVVITTISCGSSSEETATADLPAATINWITWDNSSKAEELLIEQFQTEYPQIEFKRKTLEYAIRNALNETPPPDLLNIDVEYDFDQLIQQNQLADLSELWEQAGLREQVPMALQRLSERAGKQYYIPFGFGWVGFYYNKQIFADHNLQAPQTWAQFLQICETLALAGETPLAIAGADAWSSYEWFEYLNLRLNGLEFHRGLLNGKESFADERVRNTLERLKSLFDLGYFAEESQYMSGMAVLASLSRNEKASQLTRQKAVMGLSDAYNASQLPALFLGELGFFRFPFIDPAQPKVETVDAIGYAIPVAAEHSAQAIAFLTHLSTPTSQAIIAQQPLFSSITYAPTRMDIEPAGLRADQAAAIEMLKDTAEAIPFMWLALPDQTWGGLQFYFDQFVSKRDVDAFVTKANELQQAALKQGLLSGE